MPKGSVLHLDAGRDAGGAPLASGTQSGLFGLGSVLHLDVGRDAPGAPSYRSGNA